VLGRSKSSRRSSAALASVRLSASGGDSAGIDELALVGQGARESQALALHPMQAQVHGEAMEPGREASAAVEGPGALEELEEDLLRRVLGVGSPPEEAQAQALHPLAVELVGLPQRGHLAPGQPARKGLVGVHVGALHGLGHCRSGTAGGRRAFHRTRRSCPNARSGG
jgi:hypothetical protein